MEELSFELADQKVSINYQRVSKKERMHPETIGEGDVQIHRHETIHHLISAFLQK